MEKKALRHFYTIAIKKRMFGGKNLQLIVLFKLFLKKPMEKIHCKDYLKFPHN